MSEQETDNTLLEAFGKFGRLQDALGRDVSQLWLDAVDFLTKSNPDKPRVSADRRRQLARAAVLTAAAAFEAVTNYLSGQVVQAGAVGGGKSLSQAESDCLREKRKVLEGGKIKERRQMYSSKDRFLLLFTLLSQGHDVGQKGRADLERSFEVRDRLVHPRPGDSVDLLGDNTARNAVLGFLMADVLLAQVWDKARKYQPVSSTGFASLLRHARNN